jgi:hypothetical protein
VVETCFLVVILIEIFLAATVVLALLLNLHY